MPKRDEYDFEYDEPVSIPLDTETALRAMLAVDPEPVADEDAADA